MLSKWLASPLSTVLPSPLKLLLIVTKCNSAFAHTVWLQCSVIKCYPWHYPPQEAQKRGWRLPMDRQKVLLQFLRAMHICCPTSNKHSWDAYVYNSAGMEDFFETFPRWKQYQRVHSTHWRKMSTRRHNKGHKKGTSRVKYQNWAGLMSWFREQIIKQEEHWHDVNRLSRLMISWCHHHVYTMVCKWWMCVDVNREQHTERDEQVNTHLSV